MIRKISILFFISLLFFAHHLYAMGFAPPHKYIPLRVRVINETKEVRLRIRGSYKIVDLGDGKILSEDRNLLELSVSPGYIKGNGIKILPESDASIYVNNRQFRGTIDIIKNENNKLFVVNHVDLEEYLYGVLYHEVNHNWPIEVLKAQAITARTYALYQRLVTKSKYYDLTADIYSQVYGGRTSEKLRTTRAVKLTQGLVLTYESKIFPSYFHATCGGNTTDASTLWNLDISVLRGRPCNFCDISPHYTWHKELTIDYIQSRLKEAGYDIVIVSIEILKRDSSGRILDLLIKGKDKDIKLSGNKFRLIIEPNIIRSSNFEIEIRGKYITFRGRGWGHGVGMCQWGAFNMASQGWKVEAILEYYYPGAEIVRIE
ncbi:MAG: SpoIID/LytB domain-containing protein [Candidatus Omnitrophota bacterium]